MAVEKVGVEFFRCFGDSTTFVGHFVRFVGHYFGGFDLGNYFAYSVELAVARPPLVAFDGA